MTQTIIENPTKLIADKFKSELNLTVTVDERVFPEETIYIVRVPHAEMQRAIILGNQIDQLLSDAQINGFVTIRTNNDDDLNDHIGEAAENKARDWLGISRIAAHRPERDKKGWDFLLEYDPKSSAHLRPEKAEPLVTCKLQVKGTLSDSGWIDIKLSNWDKMVKQPLPFFVLVIVFSRSNIEAIDAVYLIHIGREYVSQVLHRLRLLKGRDYDKMHEKTLRITWSQENRIESPNYGISLGNKLREYVGESAEQYVIKKLGWLKTVGYDDQPLHAQFSFQVPDGVPAKLYSQLADLATGILRELPVSRIDLNEIRFGISKPLRMIPADIEPSNLESISISIGKIPSVCETKVTLSDKRHERMVSVSCETYRASYIFPFLPQEHEKFRLVSPFVTFVLEGPSSEPATLPRMNISIQLPPNENMILDHFLKSTTALRLLKNEQPNGLIATFDFPASKNSNVSDGPNHLEIPLGRYNFDFSNDIDRILALSEKIGYLSHHFDLDRQTSIRLSTLVSQEDKIHSLYILVNQAAMQIDKVDIKYTNQRWPTLEGKKTAFLLASGALIGNVLMIAVGFFSGESQVLTERSADQPESLCMRGLSYHLKRSLHKLMHEGENYSIEPLLNECIQELLNGDEYEVVVNPVTDQIITKIDQDTNV